MANAYHPPSNFGRCQRFSFKLAPGYRNLNHGSFGCHPSVVYEKKLALLLKAEARPDDFLRYTAAALLDESRQAVGKLISAAPDEIVFVTNATTGVNTILRSLIWEEGDVIITFSTVYGGCGRTVSYICDTTALENYCIPLTYPCSDDEIISLFEHAVEEIKNQGKRPKMALFDAVSSVPGIRKPFERLTKACKQAGIYSLVDAAHGIGHVQLSMNELDCDFLTSNCHKWLYVPRGCAILYVPFRNQHLITTSLPTSHYYVSQAVRTEKPFNPLGQSTKSNFVLQFEFNGTVDPSNFLCVTTALKYRKELGGEEAIMAYCHDLAFRGGKMVAETLGTEILQVDESGPDQGRCCMVNVRLPIKDGLTAGEEFAKVYAFLTRQVGKEYDTFFQCFVHDGRFYTRLSAQIYVGIEDFEWAGKVLKEVCERVNEDKYDAQ